jgi:RNA polymerase sigma-70 factor (ECF subfamily)
MRELPPPDNIVGWLYRVVRNAAVSASRKNCRRARHEAASAAERQPWFNPATDDAIDAAAAAAALESLPIDEREVVVLRLWNGLTFEEIAGLIATSTSTAHRRYENGLKRLRQNWSVPCPKHNT